MRQSWKYTHKNIDYSKGKINNKNKLYITVLLIPRLLSPLINYRSLVMQDHDQNYEGVVKEEGIKRCL